jgi:peptidoglycan hydrolase-like protein with peptidoglycan-binding domain
MATSGRAGYGTLLHELIHALVEADFPTAPAWLNEGLASLYERTQWREQKLHGLPNWRMDRMREAKVSTLSELGDRATNVGLHSREIAEYRLLLLLMDQRDLLSDVYHLAKQGGPSFSLKNTIQQMNLTEADWREFLKETFAAYRAELARDKGALSHPDEIRFVQQALRQTVSPNLVVDGHWGPRTDEALMEFQRQQGLEVDGILGPKTTAALKRQYERARILSMPDP